MAKEYVVQCLNSKGILIEAVDIRGLTPNDAEVVFTAAHSELYHRSHTVELYQKIGVLKNGETKNEVGVKDKFHDQPKKFVHKSFKRRRDDSTN